MKFKVIGRTFSEEATYYNWDAKKNFPRFNMIDEQTWEIDVDTLDAAEKWLIKNHPDMYMGANIIGENGDFACLAVPCEEYGSGNYETVEARIAHVTKIRTVKMVRGE